MILVQERRETAYLLRKYDLSETSLIVHWFSKESGIVKTVVKGAKGKKSTFSGTLELFTLCEIQVIFKKGTSDLHSLLGAESFERMDSLRTSYGKLLTASYFSSLIEHWLGAEQPAAEVFDLFQRALNYIETRDVEWKAVTHFEKELSRHLGYSTEKFEVQKIFMDSSKLRDLRGKLTPMLKGSRD